MTCLACSLIHIPQLTYLNCGIYNIYIYIYYIYCVADNNIGTAGAISLAEHLEMIKSLEHLDLSTIYIE